MMAVLSLSSTTSKTFAPISKASYPRNCVEDFVSICDSSMTCFFCEARARARCSSISASKPALSTESPRSRAMSSVRSIGKPCSSYRRNAKAPEICEHPACEASFSNSSIPRSKVRLKASSSRRRTSFTCCLRERISGKTSPMVRESTSTSL